MTQQQSHLADFITARLTEHTEQNGLARSLVHEIVSELATEIIALQAQLADLRTLTGNQGLAIHSLDGQLTRHVKLAQHTPADVA